MPVRQGPGLRKTWASSLKPRSQLSSEGGSLHKVWHAIFREVFAVSKHIILLHLAHSNYSANNFHTLPSLTLSIARCSFQTIFFGPMGDTKSQKKVPWNGSAQLQLQLDLRPQLPH